MIFNLYLQMVRLVLCWRSFQAMSVIHVEARLRVFHSFLSKVHRLFYLMHSVVKSYCVTAAENFIQLTKQAII